MNARLRRPRKTEPINPFRTSDEEDVVRHPKHYGDGPPCKSCGRRMECIEVAERFPFSLGNVIKYVWRAGKKGDAHRVEDLEKARRYLEFEIDRLTRPE